MATGGWRRGGHRRRPTAVAAASCGRCGRLVHVRDLRRSRGSGDGWVCRDRAACDRAAAANRGVG